MARGAVKPKPKVGVGAKPAAAAKKAPPKSPAAARKATYRAHQRRAALSHRSRRSGYGLIELPEYRRLGSSQKEALRRLELVRSFILATPSTLSPEIQQAINDILEDEANRVRVVMAAMVHGHLDEMVLLQLDAERIEQAAARRDVDCMGFDSLMEYHARVTKRLDSLYKFSFAVTSTGLPSKYEPPFARREAAAVLEEKGLSELAPASRTNLREFLDAFRAEVIPQREETAQEPPRA
jgi:hypothetical protein